MNEDIEFIYKIRQILNQGTTSLDLNTLTQLYQARQIAIHQPQSATINKSVNLVFAGFGNWVERQLFSGSQTVRSLTIVAALSIGTIGIWYWNSVEQAREHDEIDSALLADELPPSAYLDPGFQAWIEPTSYSSSQ